MGNIKGKSVVITGAGKGIGRAAAEMFASEGASTVVISARTESDLLSLKASIGARGSKAVAVAADVRTDEGIAKLHRFAAEAIGTPDIILSNAGVGLYASIDETTMDDFDEIIATNIRGTYAFVKAFLPGMIERASGHIVILASVAGLHGFPRETAYCASKFAQVGFAEALDNEVREKGIKVTCICPGGVKTHFALGRGRTEGDPMLDQFMASEDIAQAIKLAVETGTNTRVLNVTMRSMIEPVA